MKSLPHRIRGPYRPRRKKLTGFDKGAMHTLPA